MNWLKRNWSLAIVAGIIFLMIIKKLIVKLATVDTFTVTESINVNYYPWAIAAITVTAIVWGSKSIKTIGTITLVLIGAFYAEEIVNFDWSSIPLGRILIAKGINPNWLWLIMAVVVILTFYPTSQKWLGENFVSLVVIAVIVWVIVIFSTNDDTPSYETADCMDAHKLDKSNNAFKPGIIGCIGIQTGVTEKFQLVTQDNRYDLQLSFKESTIASRPELKDVQVWEIVNCERVHAHLINCKVNTRYLLAAKINHLEINVEPVLQ